MNRLLILLIVIGMVGCAKQAQESTRAGGDFTVDKLFTVEQCTVYRFMDAGRYIYFTNCAGSTQWRESCGKNCTYDENVHGGGR